LSSPLLKDRLFIGIGGRVVALDPMTGQELWRQRLASSGVATVAIIGEGLYGAAAGELFRLDPATGQILWQNKLEGLGLGVVAFPDGSEAAVHAAVEQARQQAVI
jgi:outer membrane protein assembly factor BamB